MKFVNTIFYLFFPFILFAQLFDDCDNTSLTDLINPGNFNFSYINETDDIRNGPYYSGATIYYPINENDFLTSIVIVPGFMNNELTIQNWGPFLASHGIVCMTIGTNNLIDTPQDREQALLDAITTLKAEHSRLESPLNNSLDTTSIAVGGFSMGGGGAQLSAISDISIKTVIALYPYLLDSEQLLIDQECPLLIVSGQLDAIAPPFIHANSHYNNTPSSTSKQLYEVQFASHDVLSGPNGGNGEVGAKVLAWLQTFLIENHCYCLNVLDQPSTSSNFNHNVICEDIFITGCTDPEACNFNSLASVVDNSCEFTDGVCESCKDGSIVDNDIDDDGICDYDEYETFSCINLSCIDPGDNSGNYQSLNDCQQACQNVSTINENEFNVSIYPNPSSNIFNLKLNSGSETEILVTNILGEQVYFESIQFNVEFNSQIDLSEYSKGIYNLSIKTSSKISSHRLILY